MKRIGVDVGGTNTDAVLVENGRVLRSVKSPTTADVTGGIVAAIGKLGADGGAIADADAIMVGTTHFINAVVQRRDLSPVAAVRIGLPATEGLPPFSDWPGDLAGIVCGGVWMVEGGHDYDGRKFMPLATDRLRAIGREIRARGLRAIAVSAMFSPLDPADETTAAAILREEVPGAEVACSHEIGGIGLLARENATILNAALLALARTTVEAFEKAKATLGVRAPLFITQNDGTVAEAARTMAFPVFSFASGPTNSMRGAAYLSKLADALVVDVGGTTSDFGFLRAGFPREANTVVKIGDVRTLFRMPESAVDRPRRRQPRRSRDDGDRSGQRRLPAHRGGAGVRRSDADGDRYRRLRRAARRRRPAPGRPSRSRAGSRRPRARQGDDRGPARPDEARRRRGRADRGRRRRLPRCPTASKGRAGSCMSSMATAPMRSARRSPRSAATSIRIFEGVGRAEAIATARRLAETRAIAAGADPQTLGLVEAEDVPIAYLPGNALRVRIKVVGDVRIAGT